MSRLGSFNTSLSFLETSSKKGIEKHLETAKKMMNVSVSIIILWRDKPDLSEKIAEYDEFKSFEEYVRSVFLK